MRREFAPAIDCFSLSTDIVVIFREFLAGLVTFLGEDCVRIVVLCFSHNSPIFALRRDTGIRFTRRSIRARRSWDWRAYWARSLRARSVTATWSVCCSTRSRNDQDILSSCRLSTRACFWFRVIRIFFLEGLPVGVLIPSLDASSISEDLRLRVDAAILAMIVKAVG